MNKVFIYRNELLPLSEMFTWAQSSALRLERLLHWIEQKPEAGMFYSLAEYCPKDHCTGQFRCTRGTPEGLRLIVGSGYLLALCRPSVALNTKQTLALGGYNEDLHEEDSDQWWRMAMDYDIQYIPEILVGYRQHSGSLTTHNPVCSYIEGLYGQYLLLSHLRGLKPLPLDAVRESLSSFASMRVPSAKEKLRKMDIPLSQKKYPGAMLAGLKSFVNSPNYFSRRPINEFRKGGPITDCCLKRKADFWP